MNTLATLLIVDDTPSVCHVLVDMLESPEYHIETANDGFEGLLKARALKPDLILLDVMMPGMDGFEVCQQLRATPDLAEVPILMLTALDDHESRVRGIESGADDFLTKPISPDELNARVHTIVRLNRYRRLHAERAKFDWVVEQSEDGYLVIDDQDQITYANPKACLFLSIDPIGTHREPIYFRPTVQKQYLCQPSELWATWPVEGRGSDSAASPRYLVRPETESSQAFWLQVLQFQEPIQQAARQILCLKDVTSQILTMRDVQAFHRLIPHKLRSPLNSMRLGIEMLAMHSAALLGGEIADLVDMALQGIYRLDQEVTDVVQYLHAPTLARKGKEVQVEGVLPLIKRISEELELVPPVVSVSPHLRPYQLQLSEPALERVVFELFENSKKFHPRQLPQITVEAEPTGLEQIKLRITDDGVHLSPEQLEQAWTPYYQGEKYFTGQVAGMGLGLPMVAMLIWAAGGSCVLRNRPDQPGIQVELVFPISPSQTKSEDDTVSANHHQS